MVQFDMGEFKEQHTVSKLIGSSPGYIGYYHGGQLTEAIRGQPHCIVLFNEREKAHPDVCNVMLQITEDGKLTDGKGRVVDFEYTLLIMTFNIASSVVIRDSGDYSHSRIMLMDKPKKFFKPEFLNRLDDIILFKCLSKVEMKDIVDIMLMQVSEKAKSKGIKIRVKDAFKEKAMEDGYDPLYGARPLRRAITKLLEDCLAEKTLTGLIKDGDSITVDVNLDGKVTLFKD